MIKIEEVVEILSQNQIPSNTIKKIVEDLKIAEEENKSSAATGNKKKNQFVIVLRGLKEYHDKIQVGWVLQVKEDFDINKLPASIEAAKLAHNNAQKRKKNLITTLAETFSRCKAKFCKENNFSTKSKQPVQVVWYE